MQPEHSSASEIIKRATAYLAEWVAQVELRDVEQLVATGSAGKQIAATAEAKGVELIVIGSSGEGGIKRLLGSTTRARHALRKRLELLESRSFSTIPSDTCMSGCSSQQTASYLNSQEISAT